MKQVGNSTTLAVGFGGRLRQIFAKPFFESLIGEFRQLLVAMDPEQLLHQRAIERVAASEVREPRQKAPELPEAIGIREHLVAKLHARFLRRDRLVALHQAREIELELMPIAGRVGASNLAHLAAGSRGR